MMTSILITGCNRGLGLGLLKEFSKESNLKHLIVTCRDIDRAVELKQIAETNDKIHILKLDVRHTETFDEFSKTVEQIVGSRNGLNVLFNNAGCSPKSTRINMVKTDQLIDTFVVNTVGPIMLTKALLPLLKRASEAEPDLQVGYKRAAIINMSSILGSIALNTDGGLYPYRCSKVALNMVTKSLSADLQKDKILVTSLHPGWVKTALGGPGAPMDVESSCKAMVEFVKNLNEGHNGGFYQWDGKQLDW